jgi:hypothetical protein
VKKSKQHSSPQIVRKSKRIINIEEAKEGQSSAPKVKESSKLTVDEVEKEKNIRTHPTRAPVGSLTNNPEWSEIITEL